jgi:tetratricopeptide (TPR) repeat protein
VICPKCGRPVETDAVICSGCDFILDTDFLGDEILDEEKELRPGTGGVDPAVFNLADAVILGDIDEDAQAFETSDTGFHVKESTNARLYVSGRSQAMMAPDAVPAVIEEQADKVRLTPFEKHVLSYIDGRRPVEIIRIKAGLDESEVKTALATLADKGVVEVIGRALVEIDPAERTSARRPRDRRRPRAQAAGAVAAAAAMAGVGDATDRAIEEAFRTQTGLNPLAGESLDSFDESTGGTRPVALSEMSDYSDSVWSQSGEGVAEEAEPASEVRPPTAAGMRDVAVRDDDLPSDADSFDVIAGTSEIDKRAEGTASRGRMERGATNARRALRDRELADILGEDSDEGPATGAVDAPPHSAFSQASDGFDEFGTPSELDTALISAGSDSLGAGPSEDASDVFASAAGTPTPTPRMTPPGAVNDPLSDERGTHVSEVAGLSEMSMSLSELLDDSDEDEPVAAPAADPEPSLPDTGPLSLEEAGEPSLDGTDTSKVSGPPSMTPADPRDRPPEEVVDPRDRPPQLPTQGAVQVESSDEADSEEGTAAYEENPFADEADDDESVAVEYGLSEEPTALPDAGVDADPSVVTPSRPMRPAEEAGLLDEFSDEVSASIDTPLGLSSAPTGPVESDEVEAALRRELRPDESREESVTGPRRGQKSASSVEYIEDDMIIRPAGKNTPLRRAESILNRPAPPTPASRENESAAVEVEVSEPSPASYMDSQATGVLASPDDSYGEESEEYEDYEEPEEATAMLSDVGDVSAPPSAETAGDAWASEPAHPESADATMQLAGRRNAAPGYEETSVAPDSVAAPSAQISEEMSEPMRAGRGGNAFEMQEKARRLFDDALQDFRAGRVGAARMNAKLATIYDPANEEYRVALEQWGKDADGGAAGNPSQPKYALLYEEAQELEQSGDSDGAIAILERGAELHPDIAAIHNRLGVLLALTRKEYDRAASSIQRAIELDPENLHYKSNLGKILSRKRSRQKRANG